MADQVTANFLKDTYVLTIDIVKGSGSDSRQTTDVVHALALFNASSEHSWISKRFAERLGIITQNKSTENGGYTESIKLDWKCPALERYVQRTVFMIAMLANFDVLFAEQKDENSRPSERDQFQRGIQKGLLKRVVQMGIADRTMLRVVPNLSSESPDTAAPVMPTIAQLEAQLLHDTEGHRNYHKKHSCNIRSIHAMHGSDCCHLLGPGCSLSTSPTTESIMDVYVAGQSGSELSIYQGEEGIYPSKRTKLSQHITGDKVDSSTTNIDARKESSSLPSSPSLHSQAFEASDTPAQPESVSGRPATDTYCSQVIPKGDPTRSEVGSKAAVHRRNIRSRRQGPANAVSRADSMPKASTMSEGTSFTIKRSPDGSDTDTTNSDLFDPNYWTWDKMEQKYYHIDKASNEKLWYEAPP